MPISPPFPTHTHTLPLPHTLLPFPHTPTLSFPPPHTHTLLLFPHTPTLSSPSLTYPHPPLPPISPCTILSSLVLLSPHSLAHTVWPTRSGPHGLAHMVWPTRSGPHGLAHGICYPQHTGGPIVLSVSQINCLRIRSIDLLYASIRVH